MARLNLHHLRLFHAVAKTGHLTRAAEVLNLSQSALSVQLRALETALGAPLFDRKGRGLVLTDAGRIALDHAEAIFRTADDLNAALADRARPRKYLRIGALATLSRNFQMQFLDPVLQRGDVEVTIRSGRQDGLLAALNALDIDLMLTNQAPARGQGQAYLVTPLAAQPVSVIGPPDASLHGARLRDILAQRPLILPADDTAWRASFDAMVHRMGLRPRVAASADDMALLRLLARRHQGVAVLPPIVVRDELAAGVLVEYARLPDIHEDFFAVTLARRFANPLVAETIETALGAQGAAPYSG